MGRILPLYFAPESSFRSRAFLGCRILDFWNLRNSGRSRWALRDLGAPHHGFWRAGLALVSVTACTRLYALDRYRPGHDAWGAGAYSTKWDRQDRLVVSPVPIISFSPQPMLIPQGENRIILEGLMTCRIAAISAWAAITMFVCQPSFAEGQFGPTSEILGLALSMSQNQAKDYVNTTYKSSPFAMFPVKISSNGYEQKAVAGFVFELKGDAANGRRDVTSVMFNPNKDSTDIFAISRYVEFFSEATTDPSGKPKVNGTLVLKQVVLDSLIAKYGKPNKVVPEGHYEEYIWGSTAANNRACVLPASNRTSYLNEFFFDNYDVDTLASNANQKFISAINSPSIKLYANCGLVLRVNFGLSDASSFPTRNPPYIQTMSEALIDLSKGTLEFEKFSKDFFAAAAATKNSRLLQDSNTKPKF
jgi:hypothetical protein